MTALRVRCWGVMTSELYMDHLLEDGRELGADVGLEGGLRACQMARGSYGITPRIARLER